MARLFVGTSGWNYKHWKTTFYKDVKVKDWFAHYAQQFNTVEINSTFYRLQARETFEKWAAAAPKGFAYSIKGNKYLTRVKRLSEAEESFRLERERADGMGDKLAVVLWQLPPGFRKDMERLQGLSKAIEDVWPSMRFSVEFRHKSWFDDEVADFLEKHNIANCISHAGRWPMWQRTTTNFAYVRLHGAPYTYYSPYEEDALQEWAQKCREWLRQRKDVYVYFDNDANSFAPANALRLRELIGVKVRKTA